MEDKILVLLQRFVADERLTILELKELKNMLGTPGYQPIINGWIQTYWDTAANVESNLTFEQLVRQIDKQYLHHSKTSFQNLNVVRQFQKIAAILILPVIILSGYYIFRNNEQVQYAEAIVPKGQKSEIVLPDNTHIWLNSATSLRYPARFGKNNREVFLDGEAYFEVVENNQKPFTVHTSELSIKVLGTKFNVKSYRDDKNVETALLTGNINLSVHSGQDRTNEIDINPGEMIGYSRTEKSVLKSGFEADEVIGWKNNRLIFRDDTFDNLAKKIERWYDVEIIYDQSLFQGQRLTVELLEGESLERLMQIIEKTIQIDYKIDKQKIFINPKMKSTR
jgi:ferric-dicitrate binding protein FerR (iron transport regulator)